MSGLFQEWVLDLSNNSLLCRLEDIPEPIKSELIQAFTDECHYHLCDVVEKTPEDYRDFLIKSLIDTDTSTGSRAFALVMLFHFNELVQEVNPRQPVFID